MLKHVLTEHWKYEDQLKNRWNENTASIMIIMGMMDSKRKIKDTMDTNMQIISEQANASKTNIAGIRNSNGGPLDMKMNMISRRVLVMKKDATGPMVGTPDTNRIMDMSLTNGK
jgi:hypothetical protein